MLVQAFISSLLPLPVVVAGINDAHNIQLKGIHPTQLSLYLPSSSGTWKCLDGSKEIPWSAVNDDYCDCSDGSDEPGTSACPNSTFYCANAGHIGASIRSSKVGDGLCEPECCDGSDEAAGVCPNQCEEVGRKYREEQAINNKTRKTGSKIRSSYVAFAQKEKKRLHEAIAALKIDLKVKRAAEESARDMLNRVESMDGAALDLKKQSPLFLSLQNHRAAIHSLDSKIKNLESRMKNMESLLNDLESGFNPNYVDMAVISAVKEWKSMKGVKEEGTESDTSAPTEDVQATNDDDEEVQEWTDDELKDLQKEDPVSLMLAHERHLASGVQDQVSNILFSVKEYLPDSLIPTYEQLRQYVTDALSVFGIMPKQIDISADVARAKTAHQIAYDAVTDVERNLASEEAALGKLFAVDGYGSEGQWKKLEGTCLEKDTGEYTYSVCLFGSATQKSNKDGSKNNLGTYSSWSKTATIGTPEYYGKQMYTGGARCWNGPERSVTLNLSCGIENAIHTVSEPEKCEYHFTGTTPALCLAVETGDVREEL